MVLIRKRPSNFFHIHAHSNYSALDAISTVEDMVNTAVSHGQPALSLTDHGNMSGVFDLYKRCRKAGILPWLGFEGYLVSDVTDKEARRYHVTLTAFTTEGYKALVALCSTSHERENFHYKPRFDFAMVDALDGLPGVLVTSGCWYGWPCGALIEHGLVDGVPSLERRLRKMATVFKHFYVELQHHSQPDDDAIVATLYAAANRLGLPIVATQDAHYCRPDERALHSAMKGIAYGGDIGDNSFPGDSYHLASTEWVRSHYDPKLWADAESSYTDLLNGHTLSLPFLDTYKFHLPQMAKQPMLTLRKKCIEALHMLGKYTPVYRDRLEEELATIKVTKFTNYFLLIGNICQWCRLNGILINARGSANGSLVCWLMGITEVDPVKWELTFDRFLTPDRVKPPDVDLDIEHLRRGEVIEYTASLLETVQIGNYSQLGYDEEGTGSIFRTFIASARRRVTEEEWQRSFKHMKGMHDVSAHLGKQFADDLQALGDRTVYKSHGAHAAGFAIGTPELSIKEWLATMLVVSSGTRVTQQTMDDVEAAGIVKADFLGLYTLTTMKYCLEMLGKPDWHWIPLNDAKTFTMLRQGRPENGVFQLEGFTASKGCREIGVRNIGDIILVNALYRPAARDGGYTQQFLENRESKSAYYPHPIWEKRLSYTWGVAAYQEQVLEILRDLGMSAAEMNQFLTAVKAKRGGADGAALMAANEEQFGKLCAAVGMDAAETAYGWRMIEGFAAYGFNKAHATAYSLLSYRTAYLKVHFPLQFHTALLRSWAGAKKEPMYVKEVRRVGIPILQPDVNVSDALWTLDEKRRAIRRGLLSIKGVGEGGANEVAANAPYTSIEDLIERTDSRKVTGGKTWAKDGKLNGVLGALLGAGALNSIKGAQT